jgi:stage II sporulation protein Q
MKPEEPKNVSFLDEAKRRLRWKKLVSKKWFIPAVYMTVAVLVLALAWFYQEMKTTKPVIDLQKSKDTILPVEEPQNQEMILPVQKDAQAKAVKPFYRNGSSDQEKEAALVKYANTYWPHAGIDFARNDGKTFDVVAVLDGKVVRVENNPVLGQLVEVEHENGLVTVYQSLSEVKVQKGQTVKQGDVLGKAGKNRFEKDAGNHLHFEVRKGNKLEDPNDYVKSN